MKIYKSSVEDTGKRADIFIAQQYPQFSRSGLKNLFKNGYVYLKSKPINPSYKIRPGDSLKVDELLLTRELVPADLPVIHEDQDSFKDNRAIIDAPIKRSASRPNTFKIDPAGKSAITEYEIIKSFTKNGKIYSLVRLEPKTGRTHQLRVHLAYIQHPIVGDSVYGQPTVDGMYLHAFSLSLRMPSGRQKTFSSPIPKKFEDFLNG
jgi:23S rRNA-/tRNA-specific pseudouridylate synthase